MSAMTQSMEYLRKLFLKLVRLTMMCLPRAIVEDKLDHQNCAISRRFFSQEVQDILSQQGYEAEAEFTGLIRNWFRACDERGLDVQRRLTYLQSMYDYLLDKVSLSDYPPPSTHVLWNTHKDIRSSSTLYQYSIYFVCTLLEEIL